jgi:hypothetical protein
MAQAEVSQESVTIFIAPQRVEVEVETSGTGYTAMAAIRSMDRCCLASWRAVRG